MEKRLELQTLLETLLKTRNVYFQPPETLKMSYPCIIYSRDNTVTNFADNGPYKFQFRYQLILVDKNPDSIFVSLLAALPLCTFQRHYTKDNLNHDVYNIFY